MRAFWVGRHRQHMTAGAFLATSKKSDELAVLRMLVNAGPSTSSTCVDGSYSISLVLNNLTLIENYQLILTSHFMNLLIHTFQSRADCNAFGCFDFVSCQHPNFHSTHSQSFNGGSNFILQLILHTCYTNQVHIVLKFHHYFPHCLVSIFQQIRSLFIFLMPFLVIVFFQLFLSNDQCSQSFSG